jgi:acetyltransferase-like isoleucine patch superfamily enzyme
MNHRPVWTRAVDRAASALAFCAGAWESTAGPFVRLVRLASLRQRVDGDVPVSTQFDGPVYSAGRIRISLGEHCRLGRGVFLETCGGHIRLGSHVRINTGCIVVSYASVEIGNDCLIGEYVSIRDADHGMADDALIRTQPHVSAPIVIGDNVWIARGSVILKGVTIGEGAVVAANSVVNRDVPAGAIVGGAPARVIKTRQRP